MLRDTSRSSKPEYRAQYPDARPFFSECSLKVRRLLREQDQAGALPAALSISRDANTGAGQDVTGLAAAVQLRLRVAVGLQALQRCSGLLNRRARGSTVATHHFGGGTRIEKSMRGFGAARSDKASAFRFLLRFVSTLP